jgi:holo-ACP synthase
VAPEIRRPTEALVDLAAMLDRREVRAARQRALVGRFGRPVVSLTLVNPGPVKDTMEAGIVFEAACAALRRTLEDDGYRVESAEESRLATGPEAMLVVDADALELKRALVRLEERHPLGRLWDLDVIERDATSVGRSLLGLPPRTCLACDEPAHACARARRHPLADLRRVIGEKIDAFRRSAAF